MSLISKARGLQIKTTHTSIGGGGEDYTTTIGGNSGTIKNKIRPNSSVISNNFIGVSRPELGTTLNQKSG